MELLEKIGGKVTPDGKNLDWKNSYPEFMKAVVKMKRKPE